MVSKMVYTKQEQNHVWKYGNNDNITNVLANMFKALAVFFCCCKIAKSQRYFVLNVKPKLLLEKNKSTYKALHTYAKQSTT